MVANFPGPYEIEIEYTTNGLTHKHRKNCDVVGVVDPGDDVTSITLQTKDNLGVGLNAAVVEYVTAMLSFYDTGTTFSSYTFWKYTSLSFERTFISAGVLSLAGTAAVANNPASQTVYTFRTQEGGILKTVLLETTSTINTRRAYTELPGVQQAFADIHTRASAWILGRDTSYAIAFLAQLGSQNEKTFRQRYRP